MSTWQTQRGGEAKPVGDILARFMRTSGLKDKLRSPEIYDCWPEVAGPEASRHSRVVGFNNCVLHVEVDSAPWLQMLASFRKPELLQGIKQLMSGVRVTDIRFRIGSGPADADWPAPAGKIGRNPCQKQPLPPTTRETSRSFPA